MQAKDTQDIEHKKNKTGRLKKRSDFLRMRHSGVKWITKHFILQKAVAEALEKDDCVRFGVVVSKKFSKKAVDRNRAKRRLRALATEILPIYGEQACDYVFISRHGLNDAPFDVLQRDLKWALRKMDRVHDDVHDDESASQEQEHAASQQRKETS